MSLGDLDNDADLDLIVSNIGENNVSVLRNFGDGTFANRVNFAAGLWPNGVTVGDWDGDADVDVAVVNRHGDDVSILLNSGDGTFPRDSNFVFSGHNPSSIVVGDLNGDMHPDIAVTDQGNNYVRLLRNTGNGTFVYYYAYSTDLSPAFLAIGDLDGDIDLDLVVANFSGSSVTVLLNNGDGHFSASEFAAGRTPLSVAIGDLDGDLDMDLVVANDYDGEVGIFINQGDGTFAHTLTYSSDGRPASIAICDLDGDLDADVAVSNHYGDTVSLMLNNGDATFVLAEPTYNVGQQPVMVVIRDIDGDLGPDLILANQSGDVSILLNQPCGGHIPSTIVPDTFSVFRGILIGGVLTDVFASDDLYMKFNPGFTVNSAEAPVWLIFNGTLPSDRPVDLEIVMESNAGTPGLTGTLEAWNWSQGTYDVVNVSDANFNNDTVVTVDLSPGISDYAQAGTGAIRTRVGWRKTGFTFNYPWEVRLDQIVWTVTE